MNVQYIKRYIEHEDDDTNVILINEGSGAIIKNFKISQRRVYNDRNDEIAVSIHFDETESEEKPINRYSRMFVLLLHFAVALILAYLLCSYNYWQLNVVLWPADARGGSALLSLPIFIVLIFLTRTTKFEF